MRIKLFLDEDSQSSSLISALRLHDVDVLTVNETNRNGLTDESQLDFASAENRVIYTYNVGDFFQLHTEYLTNGKTHNGFIIGEQDRYNIGEQMRRLLRIIEFVSPDETENQIFFISNF